eukprot:TRINITY_DN8340_c0_g1_i2.p1 TRINITY_DN8340_c0_g1~~TRINITY_DN8340_c0_g1_i2.p1  ORF type:complete len:248 (+),score=67.35 TRINITY_DN8340_c0_g1_i2:473-1216(+)
MKEEKAKELLDIIVQLNKSPVKHKVTIPTDADRRQFFPSEIVHERTKSSSGGFNTYEDYIKKVDENASPSKAEEANDELLSKLSCTKDTIEVLKVQSEEHSKQIIMARLAWKERELTLINKLNQLKEENIYLRISSEENAKIIKTICTIEKMRELYDMEESKGMSTSKTAKMSFTSPENETQPSKILRDKRSVDKEAASVLKIDTKRTVGYKAGAGARGGSTNRIKTPHVKMIGKEMLYSPSDSLFP